MAGNRYSEEIKQHVLELGKAGKTYREIQNQYPIPKSTLSFWFKNDGKEPDRTKQLEHLKKARVLASAAKSAIRNAWVVRARESGNALAKMVDLGNTAVAKSMLAMLYWAEGSKHDKVHGLVFTNTDPTLMRLYVTLLRKTYPLDEERFRARLHLHSYHIPQDALRFWSDTLGIPTSQFGKIYVKNRSESKKFRENFQGICFVKYPLNYAREELLALGRSIAGKIK